MENNKPQLERYQKIFMWLAFVFMLIEFGTMLLLGFHVVEFPIFLVFVPQLIAGLFGTIALWKSVPNRVRIALIMAFPVTVACAIILQMNI